MPPSLSFIYLWFVWLTIRFPSNRLHFVSFVTHCRCLCVGLWFWFYFLVSHELSWTHLLLTVNKIFKIFHLTHFCLLFVFHHLGRVAFFHFIFINKLGVYSSLSSGLALVENRGTCNNIVCKKTNTKITRIDLGWTSTLLPRVVHVLQESCKNILMFKFWKYCKSCRS